MRDRIVNCEYEPKEPGDYFLHVHWSGQPIPGSPIHVRICGSTDELESAKADAAAAADGAQPAGRPPGEPLRIDTRADPLSFGALFPGGADSFTGAPSLMTATGRLDMSDATGLDATMRPSANIMNEHANMNGNESAEMNANTNLLGGKMHVGAGGADGEPQPSNPNAMDGIFSAMGAAGGDFAFQSERF